MDLIDVTPQGSDDREPVSDKILTAPNLITFIRLLMIPVFFVLLMNGYDVMAAIVFGVTAATDFLDGLVARSTHQVSRLGQLMDPFVDRLLIITVVLALLLVGRLPLWTVILVVARDVYMLIGGAYLVGKWKVRVAVIYPGKVATALLMVGCAALLLNIPLIPGLGICDFSWLPGFNADPVGWGIWFIYAGIVMVIFTTIYYTVKGFEGIRLAKAKMESEA